jgi:zinc/manganese transport system permease protein/manganese/iron transport system permease protein
VALTATLAATALFHRAFVAAAFDTRVAATMGLHPRTAHVVLVGLVTLAIVVSYGAVGSLLVIGLLLAPAVAASGWSRRIAFFMLIAALFGNASVLIGLLLSWHSGTAAGASIALSAIALAACSALLRRIRDHSASPQKDTSAPQPPLHDPSPRPPRLAALGGLRTD